MITGFKSIHPLVLMMFYGCMIAIGMILNHPVILIGLLLLTGINCLSSIGLKATVKSYGFSLTIALLMVIINPLINHRGSRVLFYLFEKPITQEAVMMGLMTGASLVIVLSILKHYQATIEDHQFIFVFGRVFPKIALLVTMTTGFLPLIKSRYKAISFSRDMIIDCPRTKRQRIQEINQRLLMLLGWSLESGIITADSMEARGYGIGNRSNYQAYKWHRQDILTMLFIITVTTITIYFRIQGRLSIRIYPHLSLITSDYIDYLLFVAVGLLGGLPVFIEGKEYIKWHFIKSKI